MGGFSIEFQGLQELEAKLQSMGTDQAARAVNRGLKAGAQVFQAAVEGAAPMRPDLPSGTALPPGALKSDIVTHKAVVDGELAQIIGPAKHTRHAAIWVEYGHRLVRGGYSRLMKNGKYRGPGKQIGTVPPHPFIRPAFEASAREATETAIAAIEEEVARQAKQ
ncbi:MAG TPA: HK97-gp10 family putative phage morphogenesis protein [Acidobacteriaceae bacterium]|nr:HK97-gp10 family putative phage morphogenesis protein [Acidobacteriaceae bacterium]